MMAIMIIMAIMPATAMAVCLDVSFLGLLLLFFEMFCSSLFLLSVLFLLLVLLGFSLMMSPSYVGLFCVLN